MDGCIDEVEKRREDMYFHDGKLGGFVFSVIFVKINFVQFTDSEDL